MKPLSYWINVTVRRFARVLLAPLFLFTGHAGFAWRRAWFGADRERGSKIR